MVESITPSINFGQLQHMRAYQSGHITFRPQFEPSLIQETPGYMYGTWRSLRNFRKYSAISPFLTDGKSLLKTIPYDGDLERYEPALTEQELRSFSASHFKPLVPVKLPKLKEVAVIYNPISGRRKDISALIEQRFSEREVIASFLHTTGSMHAWRLAQTIDLDSFDAVVAVGGDGTLHEVVNGMLTRPDGKRKPLAFIPNGSGNDTCFDLQILSVEQAIDFILKGETIRIDVNRVLMDAESESEIPLEQGEQRMRYSLINASIGFIAKCVWNGAGLKRYVGNLCYQAAAV